MEVSKIKITSSKPLNEEQRAKLENAVKKTHKEHVEISYAEDEKLIGGFKIDDGYKTYDATVLSMIKDVKRQMK